MHLPKSGLLDSSHEGIGLDGANDFVDSSPGVRHQEHQAEQVDETQTNGTHGESNSTGQEAVEPGVHGYGKQREYKEQKGAGKGQQVRRIAEYRGKRCEIGETHSFPDTGMIVENHGGNDRGSHRQQSSKVDRPGRDPGWRMFVLMVRFVCTGTFEHVLQVVRNQIETHEKEEHGHGKTSEDFSALKSKWVSYTRSLPDLKITKNVNHYAKHGPEGVKKNEVGKRSERERAGSAPEGVASYHCMTNAPPESCVLFFAHATPALPKGRHRQRVWKRYRSPRRWFEEYLV